MINNVNIGTAPNNGTGDELRTGGAKINANFAYLDANKTDKGGYTGTAQDLKDLIDGLSSIDSAAVLAALGYTPEDSANKGAAQGYAPLVDSLIPSIYLPAYVEEIVEGSYVDSTTFNVSGSPVTPATNKLYVDTSTLFVYRWGGTTFAQIQASPGTTDDVTEGSNLYFTEARVRATKLTGVTFIDNVIISATDSIVTAFGKLQTQVTNLKTSLTTKLETGGYLGTAQNLKDAIDAVVAEGALIEDQIVDGVTFKAPSQNAVYDEFQNYVKKTDSLSKLDGNKTFYVGPTRAYTSLSGAITAALNYYPNADYKITISIDEGYNQSTSLSYVGLNLSHIIITTNNLVITADYRPFTFRRCDLPMFSNFIMDISGVGSSGSIGILAYECTSLNFFISEIKGFYVPIWMEQSANINIDRGTFKPKKYDALLARGLRFLNSTGRLQEVTIETETGDTADIGVQITSTSSFTFQSLVMSGDIATGVEADGGSVVFLDEDTTTITTTGDNLQVLGGSVITIAERVTAEFTSNVAVNTITNQGIIYDGRADVPSVGAARFGVVGEDDTFTENRELNAQDWNFHILNPFTFSVAKDVSGNEVSIYQNEFGTFISYADNANSKYTSVDVENEVIKIYTGDFYFQLDSAGIRFYNAFTGNTVEVPLDRNGTLSVFTPIAENAYGTHPAFATQNDFNIWMLQNAI